MKPLPGRGLIVMAVSWMSSSPISSRFVPRGSHRLIRPFVAWQVIAGNHRERAFSTPPFCRLA